MSSDAYMEISHPEVWGETVDEQLAGRKLGAFEISSFGFGADWTPPEEPGAQQPGRRPQQPRPGQQHAATGAGNTAGAPTPPVKEDIVSTFKITKAIDKSSPDLFWVCCQKEKMKWGVIAVREGGDPSGKPFLVLEFQGLFLTGFDWSLDPGGDRDAAAKEETLTFSFESILIKYRQQTASGLHAPANKLRGFNRVDPKAAVLPLPWNEDL